MKFYFIKGVSWMALCVLAMAHPSFGNSDPQIHLEHSRLETEGSSWGTDDLYRQALKVSTERLPQLYKTALARPTPKTVYLGDNQIVNRFYTNKTVFLYRSLNVCMDSKLPKPTKGFNFAMENFLTHSSGVNSRQRPLRIQLISIDVDFDNPKNTEDCDVIAVKGKSDRYPFSHLPDLPAKSAKDLPQIVLGLFYRHNEHSLPIITFHPNLAIDYDSTDGRYLKWRGQQLVVDGRALLFHEIGHLLGFSHIDAQPPMTNNSAMSLMGVNNSSRQDFDLRIRYSGKIDIWRQWDLQQTSIYRALLWKWSAGSEPFLNVLRAKQICLSPNEEVNLRFEPFSADLDGPWFEPIRLIPETLTFSPPDRIKYKDLVATWLYQIPGIQLRLEEFNWNQDTPLLILNTLDHSQEHALEDEYGEGTVSSLFRVKGSIAAHAHGNFRLNAGISLINKSPLTFVSTYFLQVTNNPADCF